MKISRLFAAVIIISVIAAVLCGCTGGKTIVGKWIDDKTEGTIEYTDDGYYYEYANEGFTYVKTKYTAKNGKITYYLDGDKPENGYSVDYEITKDGNLVIGGEIIYRPLTVPEKDEEK